MPAFRHGKNVAVMVGRWNLTGFLNQANASQTADMADSTVFGINDKTFVMGTLDGKVVLSGVYAYDAGVTLDADAVMQNLVGAPRTVPDGVTATDLTLASATAMFTPDDIGAVVSGTNIFAGSTIATFVDPGHVTLSHVTTGTGSALPITIGSHQPSAVPFAYCPDAGFVYAARCRMGLANEATLEVDTTVSGVGVVKGELQASGGINQGRILSNGLESVAASANGTALLDFANAVSTATVNGSNLLLFCPTNTRNGTVGVKVQHSPDNVSWADLGTFATLAASAVGAQSIALALGTTINKYLRVVYTVAGSTGAASILVTATRH